MLGFYSCSLWTCSAHYFTHTNNAHFDVINRSHLYEQPLWGRYYWCLRFNPISCTRSIKLPKPEPKGHTHVSFRSFKHFNQNASFAEFICTPFDNVHQHTDPNEALAVWYKLFMDVVNRHAPIRHKRVKHSKLPPWLNKNIIQAMSDRDRLKKETMFTESKMARNKVKKCCQRCEEIRFE